MKYGTRTTHMQNNMEGYNVFYLFIRGLFKDTSKSSGWTPTVSYDRTTMNNEL
jgi:hypothetical protein